MTINLKFMTAQRVLVLLLLPASAGWSQEPRKTANVGSKFASIQSNFEMDLDHLPKIREGNGYSSSEVNTALKKTKDATLAPIPANDKPLRGYVERSFPPPVDETNEVVGKDEADKRFSLVKTLLAKLARLDSFRLNLTVNTKPPKARFDLIPRSGTHLTSTTNSRLSNVYRGEYDYSISKAGYKTIHETINFIDRAGSILECDLQPDPGPQDALPCNFR